MYYTCMVSEMKECSVFHKRYVFTILLDSITSLIIINDTTYRWKLVLI